MSSSRSSLCATAPAHQCNLQASLMLDWAVSDSDTHLAGVQGIDFGHVLRWQCEALYELHRIGHRLIRIICGKQNMVDSQGIHRAAKCRSFPQRQATILIYLTYQKRKCCCKLK